MFKKTPVLSKKNILLGLESVTRDEAIKRAGSMLVEDGYVSEKYVDAMFEREEIVSTFIGNGLAIPHGVGQAKNLIKKSGIVVLQYPDGIDYNGNTCYLVIGISGKDNDHIKILSNIAEQLGELEKAQELWKTDDLEKVYNIFVNGEK
jgi:PTS system mannitol-specific IIC component